ncbi:MAG: TIM barrel protein, partial [Clostridia bacterium]|nr:TIM barrel protein [Clostridia bacterium]
MNNRPLFGPGGNSESFYAEGFKSTLQAPGWVAARGLGAYEYQAGNGLTASLPTLSKIGDKAREHGVAMSLHAPYYISLSGVDPEKRLKSIDYITRSLEAAEALGADTIVVHTGSAAKISREEAMALAADTLERTIAVLDGDYAGRFAGIRIGLETMGKLNQLGTLREVLTLCAIDPRLVPVVDFGHLNAREQGYFVTPDDYRGIFTAVADALGEEVACRLHCHFSKIEYTSAGEKKHLTFEDTLYGPDFAPLAEVIAADRLTPRIICESAGTMAEDAAEMQA